MTGAAGRLGLSVPATSHALARLRERSGDPILVRAGRSMVLTPYAESIRARAHAALLEARVVLAKERPFVAAELERTFLVRATDHITTVLGLAVDGIARAEAPRAGAPVPAHGGRRRGGAPGGAGRSDGRDLRRAAARAQDSYPPHRPVRLCRSLVHHALRALGYDQTMLSFFPDERSAREWLAARGEELAGRPRSAAQAESTK